MQVPIHLPDLGTSSLILSLWYAHVGEEVLEGERLVEVLADSITFELTAPATGRLTQQLALPEDILTPGQTLGTIEVPE